MDGQQSRPIADAIVNGVLDVHYFAMSRVHVPNISRQEGDLKLQEISQQLNTAYPLGSVIAAEVGDVTGKFHYHIVVMGHRSDYATPRSFVEGFRYQVKKIFNLPKKAGNEFYSVKESNDPVHSIAYAIKLGNFEYHGFNPFFFRIVNNIVMSRANYLLNLRAGRR